jgi:hypothetical protein
VLTPKLDHHKGENPSDLRGKTQRPVNQFFAPRNSKRKKVDSSDEDDPDNDVADSVTGNNVVVDTATLTDNEDDLPEIDARATNTNEVVVAPGPGSSNQLHHSEDPGLVGEGAPVRPMVVGGGGEREGLVPHHSEELGLLGEGAPVRPRVAGGGGGRAGRLTDKPQQIARFESFQNKTGS